MLILGSLRQPQGGTLSSPANNYIAAPVITGAKGASATNFSATSDTQMAGDSVSVNVNVNTTISNTGGNQSHSNMQPYLCVNFIIALEGIYPQRQ